MTQFDKVCLATVTALAAGLWCNIVAHWNASIGLEAEAPVAVAFLLFVWFGQPWQFSEAPRPSIHVSLAVGGAALYCLGMVWFSTSVAVVGWNLVLWSWLWRRLTSACRERAGALALLPVMGFPWLKMDGHWLELGLRHADVWTMEQVLHIMDVPAVVVDTTVCTPMSSFTLVDECAGLNMLHSILIVGTILAFYQRRFHPLLRTLATVAGLAVLANCLRIVALGVIGTTTHTNVTGPIHNVTGVVVLLVLFWVAFSNPTTMPTLRRFAPHRTAYELEDVAT